MLNNAIEEMLNVGNVQMRYIRFGKGPSDLVILQGLSTNSLEGQAALLARTNRDFEEKYTVTVIDRREDVFEGITVRQMAADVALAMDALKLSAADVLGISQGGMIAQYLAIDRPDLVHKLVLALTLSRNNPTMQASIDSWTELTEKRQFDRLFDDMTARAFTQSYLKKIAPILPMLAAIHAPKDPKSFFRRAKACLTCNAYDELDRIKCPVLVLGGELDNVLSAEGSREIAQKLGCELYIYDGLGHGISEEEAKDFNKRVLDFLCREEEDAAKRELQ